MQPRQGRQSKPGPSKQLLGYGGGGISLPQRTYSFGLSEDVNATVDITGPVEVEDLEALKDYVDTLIKSWKRKSQRPDLNALDLSRAVLPQHAAEHLQHGVMSKQSY